MKAIPTLARWRSLLAVALLAAGAGCSGSSATAAGDGRPSAVAAEDVWGSLLAQLAGPRVKVTSIVHDPAIDPHDYDPRPTDAAAVADSRLVVVNGVGYDPWATRLIGASPKAARRVLDVGKLVGARPGQNPHRWYVPADVHRVVDEMVTDLKRIDPAGAAFFDARAAALTSDGLKAYDDAVARIRTAYAGTPVAVSESIFDGMAEALGLVVLTPRSFSNAVAEGNEPTPGDKETVDRQLAHRQVAAFVYNRQNTTPDVRALTETAGRAGVPVVAVTETLVPRGAAFQDWQLRQLLALEAAFASAGPR
jgi:zinc/manganese transport system substrate-binding protein